jgi:hypothetical protein
MMAANDLGLPTPSTPTSASSPASISKRVNSTLFSRNEGSYGCRELDELVLVYATTMRKA